MAAPDEELAYCVLKLILRIRTHTSILRVNYNLYATMCENDCYVAAAKSLKAVCRIVMKGDGRCA